MINMVMVHQQHHSVNAFSKTNNEAFQIGCNVQPAAELQTNPSYHDGKEININVMGINVQAFNACDADHRKVYEALDDFQSRRPINVIKANRPILILDEPQKREGSKTLDSFN